ncbi:response regulator transcription factor [Croceivirga thetidis]|uniref:Response regulator transcription factor n=1 Tax=Croceivirga thetidis TaxID=2721623 RepID=A0ABX1GRQ3_9FLAO|nr:response regulator transcription factor [Croceivirga thetidis]NKI32279.1 response regulator transcription factor [Croceivirga thetidis]
METKQLLLAEDDEMLASLLDYRLRKDGYDVCVSHNGKSVKENLQKRIPDAIVCDIMMPYFSGIELVDYVRNDLKSNVPIIMISSASNDENILSAFEMGANDFVPKPVSPTELLARITKELKRSA